MADMKKIATRVSYGNTLVELARQGADNLVVFDADLAAATKTEIFRKEFPDRHFDCGIAEQNMVGVAAGMSTLGYVPFVSSFAMFVAGRGFEQIRNSIGYPHLNVKIAATHAGLSVGEDGASHQCCEDIALMRSIPGMVILSPADDVEARAAVIAAYDYNGPVYLRFSRLATPVFHDPATYQFQIGKGEKLTDGYDIAVIATGLMVPEALRAAVLAKRQGISIRVINMPTIKPIDEEIILTAARWPPAERSASAGHRPVRQRPRCGPCRKHRPVRSADPAPAPRPRRGAGRARRPLPRPGHPRPGHGPSAAGRLRRAKLPDIVRFWYAYG